MKSSIAVALVVLAQTSDLFAGAQNLIKQRAKDLRDQNNTRQGVPAPPATRQAPALQPPAEAPTPITLTAQQLTLAHLQEDLGALRPGTPVTPEMKQRLARDLISAAQGKKPTLAATSKLADELSSVLAQKLLANVTRARLAQNLKTALNPGTLPEAQVQLALTDIASLLKSNGVPEKDAARVGEAVRSVSGELQKSKAK